MISSQQSLKIHWSKYSKKKHLLSTDPKWSREQCCCPVLTQPRSGQSRMSRSSVPCSTPFLDHLHWSWIKSLRITNKTNRPDWRTAVCAGVIHLCFPLWFALIQFNYLKLNFAMSKNESKDIICKIYSLKFLFF